MFFLDTDETNSILHVMIVQVQNPSINQLQSGLCLTVNRFENFVLVAALILIDDMGWLIVWRMCFGLRLTTNSTSVRRDDFGRGRWTNGPSSF